MKTNQVILACQHFCEKKFTQLGPQTPVVPARQQCMMENKIRYSIFNRSESLAFKGMQDGKQTAALTFRFFRLSGISFPGVPVLIKYFKKKTAGTPWLRRKRMKVRKNPLHFFQKKPRGRAIFFIPGRFGDSSPRFAALLKRIGSGKLQEAQCASSSIRLA